LRAFEATISTFAVKSYGQLYLWIFIVSFCGHFDYLVRHL